jgi:hypothetical protein
MRTSSKDPYALTTRILRKQLDALPLEVREAASNHYIATLETKLLVDQTYQCQMISKLEKMLRVDADSGTFVAVGGHESGVYESFFRVCPGRFMSRSQFIYVKLLYFIMTLLVYHPTYRHCVTCIYINNRRW